MTKAEREALASLVRQRIKLLKHDVHVRKLEMIAELDRRLSAQFAAGEKSWADSLFLIAQARDECNRKVNDVMRQFTTSIGEEWPDRHDADMVHIAGYIPPFPRQKNAARKRALADIDAAEATALHQLATTENTLLTELLTAGLESADAQAFIARIPDASALMVSTGRLAEIVGPMDEGPGR